MVCKLGKHFFSDFIIIYQFQNLNQTGKDLIDLYDSMLPFANFYRYEFDLSETCQDFSDCTNFDSVKETYIEPSKFIRKEAKSTDLDSYSVAGVDFPMINYQNYYGARYNHIWSNGFGTVLPDRYVNFFF